MNNVEERIDYDKKIELCKKKSSCLFAQSQCELFVKAYENYKTGGK